jgi:hypothetical protein
MKRIARVISMLRWQVLPSRWPIWAEQFTPPLTHPAIEYGKPHRRLPSAVESPAGSGLGSNSQFEAGAVGTCDRCSPLSTFRLLPNGGVFEDRLQARITNPKNPRAIYFNDSVVVCMGARRAIR